ncbi:MAG: peptidyl-prolyl cis-trans isomerase, partial [Lachnospiraceae bacterium]
MKSPKRIKLMVLLVASMLLLCGCKIGNTEIVYLQNIWPNQVFKIDDEVCSKKEARVYLVNYRNIYGASYGVDLWQQDSNEESLETYIKEKALTQMARIKCMNGLAKEKDISLSGEEKKKAAKAAETYYKSLSKEERKYLDVKQSDIEDMYQEYLLAAKVYQSLTDKVDTEISDDEARVMEVMQIFVSDEKKAEEIKARLQNGEDFAALAGSYNEKGSIQTSFGREDVPEEVAEEAFE